MGSIDLNKFAPRILNGDEIVKNSKPFLVDVSDKCTGSIIGKMHILSAAHCFDNIRNWDPVIGMVKDPGEYDRNKYFYVGTHKRSNNPRVDNIIKVRGLKKERDKIDGMDSSNRPVKFPIIDVDRLNVRNGLIDIAVVTLKKPELDFTPKISKFTPKISKASIDYPSTACQTCDGDCGDEEFSVYGWGLLRKGIRETSFSESRHYSKVNFSNFMLMF